MDSSTGKRLSLNLSPLKLSRPDSYSYAVNVAPVSSERLCSDAIRVKHVDGRPREEEQKRKGCKVKWKRQRFRRRFVCVHVRYRTAATLRFSSRFPRDVSRNDSHMIANYWLLLFIDNHFACSTLRFLLEREDWLQTQRKYASRFIDWFKRAKIVNERWKEAEVRAQTLSCVIHVRVAIFSTRHPLTRVRSRLVCSRTECSRASEGGPCSLGPPYVWSRASGILLFQL